MSAIKTSKKMKVSTLVIAGAIGFSVMATSAFAYSSTIRDLIYSGVDAAVTAIIPSIGADLNANQANINSRITQDIANAKDYVLTSLNDYRSQVVANGIAAQEAKYQDSKYYFDQDVEGAVQSGKSKLDSAAAGIVNNNTALTDAQFEAAISAASH